MAHVEGGGIGIFGMKIVIFFCKFMGVALVIRIKLKNNNNSNNRRNSELVGAVIVEWKYKKKLALTLYIFGECFEFL